MTDEQQTGRPHRIDVSLTDEEFTAVEGWRAANSLVSSHEAARELIQLGLLSEIRRIYLSSASRKRE